MRPEFKASLTRALCLPDRHGNDLLPLFREDPPVLDINRSANHRPFGVVGDHLRRSNVARYRQDCAVCRSHQEVVDAVR
jgi:hypothetical protein